jgi:hypothetical protein
MILEISLTLLSVLVMTSKIAGYIAFVISLIVAIITFVITWLVSEFFIPPRNHWSQSRYSIFVLKLGMASGAAFWVFLIVGSAINSYLGK